MQFSDRQVYSTDRVYNYPIVRIERIDNPPESCEHDVVNEMQFSDRQLHLTGRFLCRSVQVVLWLFRIVSIRENEEYSCLPTILCNTALLLSSCDGALFEEAVAIATIKKTRANRILTGERILHSKKFLCEALIDHSMKREVVLSASFLPAYISVRDQCLH